MPSLVSVEDAVGQIVTVNARIIYPVRESKSNISMKQARVESIWKDESTGEVTVFARNPQGRQVQITCTDRIVLIPQDTPR